MAKQRRSQAEQATLDKQLQEDIERGVEDFGLQTQSYGRFLIDVIERADSPIRLTALGKGFGESAKHALRAIELGLVNEGDDDAWDIRKAILYSRIKDDGKVRKAFDHAQQNASLSWDDHKAIIRSANGTGAAHKPSLAEQTIDIIDKYSSTAVKAKYTAVYDALNDITDELAALPAVRRALTKRQAK